MGRLVLTTTFPAESVFVIGMPIPETVGDADRDAAAEILEDGGTGKEVLITSLPSELVVVKITPTVAPELVADAGTDPLCTEPVPLANNDVLVTTLPAESVVEKTTPAAGAD